MPRKSRADSASFHNPSRSLVTPPVSKRLSAHAPRVRFRGENRSMRITNQNLPQLYRFCFLMLGNATKAQGAFQSTVREAALRAAEGEPPANRLWFFRDARWRCVEAGEHELQAEKMELEEHELSLSAAAQISNLSPEELAIWISAAPEPQRSALALYYLDEFSHREMLSILEMKPAELPHLIASGRRQFQAWLNAAVPHEEE